MFSLVAGTILAISFQVNRRIEAEHEPLTRLRYYDLPVAVRWFVAEVGMAIFGLDDC
jgi:hypothetical protein